MSYTALCWVNIKTSPLREPATLLQTCDECGAVVANRVGIEKHTAWHRRWDVVADLNMAYNEAIIRIEEVIGTKDDFHFARADHTHKDWRA